MNKTSVIRQTKLSTKKITNGREALANEVPSLLKLDGNSIARHQQASMSGASASGSLHKQTTPMSQPRQRHEGRTKKYLYIEIARFLYLKMLTVK